MQEGCVRAGTAPPPVGLLGLSLEKYQLILKIPPLLTGYNLPFADFNVKICQCNLEIDVQFQVLSKEGHSKPFRQGHWWTIIHRQQRAA